MFEIASLAGLLQKNAKLIWTDKEETCLRNAIRSLQNHIILAVSTPDDPLVMMTDASDFEIGFVLLQRKPDEVTIFDVGSRKLTSTELKWTSREKEALTNPSRRQLYPLLSLAFLPQLLTANVRATCQNDVEAKEAIEKKL